MAIRCCLTMSRLHEVRDLKESLVKRLLATSAERNRKQRSIGSVDEEVKAGDAMLSANANFVEDDATTPISNKQLVIFELKDMTLSKFLDDRFIFFEIHCRFSS